MIAQSCCCVVRWARQQAYCRQNIQRAGCARITFYDSEIATISTQQISSGVTQVENTQFQHWVSSQVDQEKLVPELLRALRIQWNRREHIVVLDDWRRERVSRRFFTGPERFAALDA